MNRAKKKSLKWITGLFIIGGAIVGISLLTLQENIVYFYTPEEAYAKAEELSSQTVKIGGMVQPGTVNWDAQNLLMKFRMTDLKGHEIDVTYRGSPPDLFKEGQGVVVEGRIEDSAKKFVATKLMVKHSEEYKKTGDHTSMDKELLEKSLFKE